MRRIVGLLLMTLAAQPILAKENWPLSIDVLSTKNIENEHGTFKMSWGGGAGGAGWAHRIAEHAFVVASDGNSYELVPDNAKDMLLPGTYKAKIEKRDLRVCEPKDNGNCREVKFKIVAAVPTVNAAQPPQEAAGPPPRTADPAPNPAATVPLPAPPASTLPSTITQASLSIDSTPSGADIEIDGAFVGNTPSTINAERGNHQIVVKKKGFADWKRTLNVTGGTVHLNAELEQESPKQ